MTATHVALLRGINVGGNNALPMAQLRQVAEGLLWQEVATYIQSGNLVFAAAGPSATHEAALHAAILEQTGLDIAVIILTRAQWLALEAACPWPDVPEPKLVHAFVYPSKLSEQARSAIQAAHAQVQGSDEVAVHGRVLYVHTPGGFSRSALVPALDRAAIRRLTGRGTARNLATVRKITGLLQA